MTNEPELYKQINQLVSKLEIGFSATEKKLYLQLVSSFPLVEIEDERAYEIAMEVSDLLLDYGKLSPGGKAYFEELSSLIERYESRWQEEKDVKPRQLLKFLMEQNGLKQIDLAKEFGGSSRISEYLKGDRELSLAQIVKLAKRFAVSPAAFIEQSIPVITKKRRKSPRKLNQQKMEVVGLYRGRRTDRRKAAPN